MTTGRTFIRGGRVVCPDGGIDAVGTVVVEGDRIAGVHPGEMPEPGPGDRVIDATGRVVAPAFVDLHAHFGEPGEEHKEDIGSGCRAAVHGGFGAVALSPATSPPNDNRAATEYLVARGRAAGGARVLPVAALTRGCEGRRLTEMFDLRDGGAVALGDGFRALADAGLLRRAMEYARGVGLPVFELPEDAALAAGGVMHEGPVATRLGLRGVPAAAEDVVVMRDIALAEQTGVRLHLGPISTRGAVRAIRMAREAGLPVTCAVTAAHLHLTDEAVAAAYDPNLRVQPPLRPVDHVEALRAALADGTIDAVASGHRPQSPVEKQEVEFDLAEPGMSALETTLGLTLRLVQAGVLDLSTAIARLAAGPARVLGLESGRLRPGAPADIVVFDPEARVRVEAANLASRARNTPFLGQVLPGRVEWTLVAGRAAYGPEGERTEEAR